jgi:hypothetical protein
VVPELIFAAGLGGIFTAPSGKVVALLDDRHFGMPVDLPFDR